MIKLVIADETGTTTVVPFVREEISIGRAEGNAIRLTERNISRKHARLKRVGDTQVVSDLNSYNGVLLNGQRIDGEAQVKPGDFLQIGDYFISVQIDKSVKAVPAGKEEKAPSVEPTPAPTELARLVMMTEPAAGTEYRLLWNRAIRIGRLKSLDIPVEHRSVSREHATIRPEGGSFRVIDAGSVNGIRINKIKVKEALLNPNDIIEMGKVVFRYVAAGQTYFFDSIEAAKYARRGSALSSRNLQVAAGVAAVSLIAIAAAKWSQGADITVVTTLDDDEGSKARVEQARSAAVEKAFSKYVGACRGALAGERYAEAIAHAARALKIMPSGTTAQQCKDTAERQHEQEQIFVRGKAVFAKGDVLEAYREFEQLDPNSSFRKRPEVAQAAEKIAWDRIERSRSLLRAGEMRRAVLLVDNVLRMANALPEQHTAAREIKSRAKRQERARPSLRSSTPSRRRSRGSSSGRTSTRASESTGAPVEASAGLTPIQVASACLAQGDNQCVIRALAGKARTAQELGLLIETYRALGDNGRALMNMSLYLKRFPSGSRAGAYRQILQRSGR